MGAGLAQIGIVLVLTVIGLPLFFFGLMAALDRFERSLSAQPRTVAPPGAVASQPAVALPAPQADAAIVTLPVASSASSGATSNPAAAV